MPYQQNEKIGKHGSFFHLKNMDDGQSFLDFLAAKHTESEKRILCDDVIRIVVLFVFVLPAGIGECFVEGAESSRPGLEFCYFFVSSLGLEISCM